MSQALRQLDQGEESPVDKVAVLDYLSYAIYQQGEIEKALEITKRLLTLGESQRQAQDTFSLLKQRSEEEEEKEEKALRQSDEGKSESQTEDKPKKKKKAFKEPIPERKMSATRIF
ncbi:hypothetical protein CRUP_017933 [Coryphaenoides rupestris]|nr:hypothetical protein CRUP_017933 [Coryphaenoides rupestris]